MSKEEIKKMMASTGQELLYEDEFWLEFRNPNFGESICFEFNVEGLLCSVSC